MTDYKLHNLCQFIIFHDFSMSNFIFQVFPSLWEPLVGLKSQEGVNISCSTVDEDKEHPQ